MSKSPPFNKAINWTELTTGQQRRRAREQVDTLLDSKNRNGFGRVSDKVALQTAPLQPMRWSRVSPMTSSIVTHRPMMTHGCCNLRHLNPAYLPASLPHPAPRRPRLSQTPWQGKAWRSMPRRRWSLT